MNSSKVKVDTVGVYNVQFSAQLYRVQGGSVKEAVIWLRKNGVNVPDTSTRVTMQSNSDFLVAAWNFFISLSANDYIELISYNFVSSRGFYVLKIDESLTIFNNIWSFTLNFLNIF